MLCLLLATFYCLMAAALPARPVFCPIEESPWTISNIVVFTSNISGSDVLKNSVGTGMGMGMTGDTTFSTESFIDFTFCDANEGLHLEVECSRITNGTISDEINFYPCDRQGVVFQYYGRTLEIQRAYKSPCLGEFPYNGAIAFGRGNMSFSIETSSNGSLATQTRMEMPISSLS